MVEKWTIMGLHRVAGTNARKEGRRDVQSGDVSEGEAGVSGGRDEHT